MDEARLGAIELRLARMESRLVQLMIYLGADPAERYDAPAYPAIVRRVREEAKVSLGRAYV